MQELIEDMAEIAEDSAIPKRLRDKIEGAIGTLRNEEMEASLRANKALQELDDISDDPQIPSYLRTELWNIVSRLETF